jgi:pimeloyl-ACP methyl ester carboxylesterase
MAMIEQSFLGLGPHGFHRVVYFEWGDPCNDRVLVCVHGLTRRGRDFDALARALEERFRVICVDLPGRGASDWLPLAADYQPTTYIQDIAALIARLGVPQVDWLGVSLGGLMGMMLAAQPKTPIRRLVLDDIGGYVGAEALQRIAAYVGQDPAFPDREGLAAYMREINTGYGPLTDEQWAHLLLHGARQDADGQWRQHYDPKLAEPFKEGFSEPVALWPLWDMITCPVLLLRGALSDVLTPETAAEMVGRKPATRLVEFSGIGHAPMLMDDAQIRIVAQWLTDAET